MKKCDTCRNTASCENYKSIAPQEKLELVECCDYAPITCYMCQHASIFESSHEWLSNRCKATGEVTDRLYPEDCKYFKEIQK